MSIKTYIPLFHAILSIVHSPPKKGAPPSLHPTPPVEMPGLLCPEPSPTVDVAIAEKSKKAPCNESLYTLWQANSLLLKMAQSK